MDIDQPSFTDIEYGNRRRVSRREKFLEAMDSTIPWASWVAVIEPHYYADRPGKRLFPIEGVGPDFAVVGASVRG